MTARTDTVIIGAGQAGLSLSRHLAERAQGHVVLERGRVGERWHSERWDSLRLLSPNWLNRLDGTPEHADPDGFLSRNDFVDYLDRYARLASLPVREHVEVVSVERGRRGFRVRTDAGDWLVQQVVVATGDCGVPFRPRPASDLPAEIAQVDANRYRNPAQLPLGAVLVVGGGPSGLQIAAELRRAGRDVVLAVGNHARTLRRYRGKDILHWLDAIGDLEQTVDEVPEETRSRRAPSLALSGQHGGEQIDLAVLSRLGVRLTGRLEGISGSTARFADDLRGNVTDADRKLRQLLERIDEHVERTSAPRSLPPADRVEAVVVGATPTSLDLLDAGVSTVVWATGYRRVYPWLHVSVLDDRGEIVHRHGATPVAGLHVLGLRFQTRRSSHFIGRVGRDASTLAWQIAELRASTRRSRAPRPLLRRSRTALAGTSV